MKKIKLKGWFAVVVCTSLAFAFLISWRYQTQIAKETKRETIDSEYPRERRAASELIHTLIGTYKAETGTYDRLPIVSPVASGSTNLPEMTKIEFPVLVEDVDDGYVGFSWAGPSRGMGSRFYTGIDQGKIISAETYSDEFYKKMDELRWMIIRTYGRLDTSTYQTEDGNLSGMPQQMDNWFCDIWVVDLKAMIVVAHKRYTDEPLPDVIHYTNASGSDYDETQEKRLDNEIASWILENTR